MTDILTREDYLAALGTHDRWRIVDFYFTENTPDDGIRHVQIHIVADSLSDALEGAKAVLDVIKGKAAFIRVPPEADSLYDYMDMKWQYRGYVRFSFKNEPGDMRLVSPDKDAPVRYLGLVERR